MEWGIGLLAALVAWLGVTRLPMRTMALVGAVEVAAAFAGSWLAFGQDQLIDPFPMLAPGAATAAAMVVMLVVEGRRAHAHLEVILEDQRHHADQHQQLLLNELNHRVKNTLATVQSIAMQTSRNAHEPARFAEAFTARIGALARAHELLSEASWDGALLRDVIRQTLAPYVAQSGEGRVSLAGPAIHLGPNAAVTLNMAFHELATNAAKYGALSVDAGRVEVTWRLEDGAGPAILGLEWRETGGPPVTEPVRRGFGSRLIEQALAREFEGEAELSFVPAGVICRMRLPLSAKMRRAA
jgi:two-component sensor histidine kinase